ncbi:MAG: NAD(P)/FAD-dependent oxidoreductase [Acetobacteraceae bacterium]
MLAAEAGRWQVALVSREPYPPYERPPLPKGILLGTAGFDNCLLWPNSDPARARVERRTGVSVETIERDRKILRLSNGERLDYDFLALATGSCARRLAWPGSDFDGIRHLRSIDDALAIRERFAEGKRLIVVGGGFVGQEVAACARQRKLDVTLVEASDRLLARLAPSQIAGTLAKRHAAESVALNMRTMVERFIGNGRAAVKAVELSSGQILPCDLALVGIGAKPETGLAAAAGLDVTVANDHARVVASARRAETAIYDTVPRFWSDQYDLTLQIARLRTWARRR